MNDGTADRKRMRALLRWMGRPGGPAGGMAIALPFIASLLIVAQAYALASILHRAIVEAAGIAEIGSWIALLAGILGLRALLSFAGERAATKASERIKADLRGRIFGRLIRSDLSGDAARASGAIAASLVEHVDQLDGYYSRFRPAAIQAACLPLAFGLAVIRVDFVVALLFLITAPLIPLFMALAGWGAEAAMRDQAQALTRLSGYFADRLRGIITLKLFGRAQTEVVAVSQAGEALRQRTLRVLKIAFLSSAVLEFFAALGVAGVALYVGLSYLGFLKIGAGLSLQGGLFCLLMAPEVYQPLRLLAAHYHDKKSAESAVVEIEAQTGPIDGFAEDQPPAGVEKPVGPAISVNGSSLVIRRLSIVTPDARDILRQVRMSLPAGSHAVLVGASGVGKSSLLQAIARLRTFEGEILIDRRSIRHIPENRFRQQVAILNQRPFLFPGSIADNLRLANPTASDTELVRAGEMACLFDDLSGRSLQLDTMLGDGRTGISGGQAQRLSLARIFLRDASLLLLDEPTAHLDIATEATVLDALTTFAAGRTMLIATHSPATIARFPNAYEISAGTVIPVAASRHPSLSSAEADAA